MLDSTCIYHATLQLIKSRIFAGNDKIFVISTQCIIDVITLRYYL